MSEFVHKFRVEDLSAQATIQSLRPGERIARAITEIQNKTVAKIKSDDLSVKKSGNTITINLPEGGEQYMVLQRGSNNEAIFDVVRAI